MERTVHYIGREVTVVWKPDRCIHSKRCWKELPEVFDPKQRKWVQPDAADAERVREQVRRCPSGALSLPTEAVTGTGTETQGPAASPRVQVTANGPLIVQGRIEVVHADGRVETKEERCALCRCGASANKPYCDGSHRHIGFEG